MKRILKDGEVLWNMTGERDDAPGVTHNNGATFWNRRSIDSGWLPRRLPCFMDPEGPWLDGKPRLMWAREGRR
jgi:hypothetical protein